MHYYKKNIGDYAKKTGRLSILQHGAYTLLLDACYDREQFPTYEEAIEWTWALSDEEIAAVEFVLARFFKLEDGRYVQNRVREEIEEYNGKSLKNKQIALEREAKRREKSTNRTPDVHETPPNQEPLTNNHKPITNTKNTPRKAVHVDKPHDVSEAVWTDFLKIRKQKRAPLSETALDGIRKEADKAGLTLQSALEHCCSRGWQGFQADWLAKPRQNDGQSTEPKWAKEKRERMEEFLGKRSRTIEMQSVEIVQESLQ